MTNVIFFEGKKFNNKVFKQELIPKLIDILVEKINQTEEIDEDILLSTPDLF